MISGVLVAESLRPDTELTDVPLRVTALARRRAGDVGSGQPDLWTLLSFEVDDEGLGDTLAQSLSAALSSAGGWYADFASPTRAYVVFPGRVFSYPRGDRAGRAAATEYGRTAGVPEDQLDWKD